MQESTTSNNTTPFCPYCGNLRSSASQQRTADLDILREFGKEVYATAGRNALNVNEILLAIVGAIVWLKDDNPIELRSSVDQTQKELLVSINRSTYFLSYNDETKRIDLKEATRGTVIYSFSNSTQISEMRLIFKTLGSLPK